VATIRGFPGTNGMSASMGLRPAGEPALPGR
jgi:hypothetical protein